MSAGDSGGSSGSGWVTVVNTPSIAGAV